MSTITKSILVLSGITLGSCQSHVPAEKQKPSVEVSNKYFNNGKYSGIKSNERREEILRELKLIKDQIRRKAESFQLDRNTRITGYTAQQKTMVRCARLLDRIATYKA